jgi:nucleoside-diphosphate-sugar epimerase
MTQQSVVVLGASGFIGRRLVGALAACGWARPVAVSRRIGAATLPAGVERVALDATEQSALAPVVASASAVVSCIAGSARDIVRGGEALLQSAGARTSPPQVIYLSSIAAYGSVRGVVHEDQPLLGDLTDYSAAKAAVEKLAAPLPFVLRLRPGIVYGPGSDWWTDRIARLLVGRRLGDLGADGMGSCNLVHVDDVAGAIVSAIERRLAGTAINLGDPAPPTWNDYFREYAAALGTPPVRISAARLRLETTLFAPFLKGAEILAGGLAPVRARPAIRSWLVKLFRHDIRMDVRRAEELLAMRWRPRAAALQECAAWFRTTPQGAMPARR